MKTAIGLVLALALLGGACDEAPVVEADATEVVPGKGDDPSDPNDRATFVGVLPDFAPVQGVHVHRLLRDLAPAFERSLRETLGAHLVESTTGYGGPSAGFSRDTSLVWTRDFFPLVVGTPEGEVVVTYLSVNPTRSGFSGSSWVPVTPPSPDHQFYKTPGEVGGEFRKTEQVPLLLEGGNLVSTGRWIITTDKLVRDNEAHSEGSDGAHLRAAGWQLRSRDEVLDLLAGATRTPRERIIVIEAMPGEKTDHADLAVMALGPDEVMVPEVRDDILDIITYGHEIELGWRTREHLDALADTLEARGLTVRRLPMLAPVFLADDEREPTGYNAVFYSPTNALQVHLGDMAHVWLPTFDPAGFPVEYIALAASYVDAWRGFFEARDMTVTTIDATELGRAYGLFHCVTAPAF